MAEVSDIKLSGTPTKIQTATSVEEAELQLRKSYSIPDGLVQLTRDMARQIFYHDPEHVEAFLADYLEGRLEEDALAAEGKYPIDASAYSNPRGEGCMNILGEAMNADGTWYNNLLAGIQNPDDRQMAALLEASSRLGMNGVLDDFDGMAGYPNVDIEAEAKAKREREADEEFELFTGEYYMPEGFELLGVDLSGTHVTDVSSKLNPTSKAVSKLLDGSDGADGAQYSESGKLLSGGQDGSAEGAQYSESGRLLSGNQDGAAEGAQYSESGRLLPGSQDGAVEGAQYSESGRLLPSGEDGEGASSSGANAGVAALAIAAGGLALASGLSGQGGNEGGLSGVGQDSSGLDGAGTGSEGFGGTGTEFDESGKPVSGAGVGMVAGGSLGQGQSGAGQGGVTQSQVNIRNRQLSGDDPTVLEEWPTTVQPYLSNRTNGEPQGDSTNMFMVLGMSVIVIAAAYFLARAFGYLGGSEANGQNEGGLFGRRSSGGTGTGRPMSVSLAMDVYIENQNIARALGHGLPEAQGLAKCPVHANPMPLPTPKPVLPSHLAQARKI